MAAVQNIKKAVVSRWMRLAKTTQWIIVGLVVLLVAIRLAMPYAIKYYVNQQLAKIPDYRGRIGDVTVHLYRGAYQIHNIDISKTSGNLPVPLFSSPLLDLSLQWKELIHGSIVGKIFVKEPKVNFVSADSEEQSQSGASKPWGETIASLFPFKLNRFEIQNGEVHFQNFQKNPPVNIYVTNLTTVATNLTNAREVGEKLPAGLKASGDTLGKGHLDINLKMNPLEKEPTFELDASLTNVNIVDLNPFLRSYGKFDVERGQFSLFTSVASVEGEYKGNLKVLFQNLDVFAWDKERKKNVLQIFWEGVVGTLVTGFKNHPHDQLAAQIPISGSFTNLHTDLWSAAGSLLRNAFYRALIPQIDKKYRIEDVDPAKASEVQPDPDKSKVKDTNSSSSMNKTNDAGNLASTNQPSQTNNGGTITNSPISKTGQMHNELPQLK